jgi:hypothetical protein
MIICRFSKDKGHNTLILELKRKGERLRGGGDGGGLGGGSGGGGGGPTVTSAVLVGVCSASCT